MNAKRKIVIDCDPGIDDALALMLALSSLELEVLGITVVCGNVPVDIGVKNVYKILKVMNRLDIPVYRGAEVPMERAYISAQDTHGMDGLGESGYEEVLGSVGKLDAVSYLIDVLKREKNVSIIAIGPLTNIAGALKKEPEAFTYLDEFISMGGVYKSHGNCSPVAEYNYWCDPDAAKYVYENLGTKIHMVGLDVTRKIVLTPNILEYMQILNPVKGEFIKRITRFYYDFHWEYERVIGCVINDPLAVAYFINRELCSGFSAYTTIETQGISIGQSVVDAMNFWKKDENSLVLTEVDKKEFMVMLLQRVFGGDEQEIRCILQQIMV